MSEKMYLILEDGTIFKGKSFGSGHDITGEVVFTTGMTGYLETLTDKSYYGQIILQTFPLIGNYGIIPEDFESSAVSAKGYIVKNWCQEPSNFRSGGNLDTFLKEQNVTGIYDLDTRQLTKIIREKGVMNGKITSSPENAEIENIRNYMITDAVTGVSTKRLYIDNIGGFHKIALLDLGMKEGIKRELIKRNCEVYVFPHNSSAEEIYSIRPDGIMLSNGPGDPAVNHEIIKNIQMLLDYGIPMFGICLGHQLLALANGFKTQKLKYGHRGANQPVKDLTTGRVYITSQNHGYSVVSDSIDKSTAREIFVNVNDRTCEGIEYLNVPAFSVQFHPEACAGPMDTGFLFDRFIKYIGETGRFTNTLDVSGGFKNSMAGGVKYAT